MNHKSRFLILFLLIFLCAFLEAEGKSERPGSAWSPYLVGALIGVLSMLTFYFSHRAIGTSSAYAQAAGLCGKAIAPEHTQSLPYYQENQPKIDWEVMFVGFIVLGAFLAAWHGGELTGIFLPALWVERFGNSFALRGFTAFLGGVFLSYGARLAGGCTSGHGISGTLQLAVGSWISVICFFVSGAVVAHLLYRV